MDFRGQNTFCLQQEKMRLLSHNAIIEALSRALTKEPNPMTSNAIQHKALINSDLEKERAREEHLDFVRDIQSKKIESNVLKKRMAEVREKEKQKMIQEIEKRHKGFLCNKGDVCNNIITPFNPAEALQDMDGYFNQFGAQTPICNLQALFDPMKNFMNPLTKKEMIDTHETSIIFHKEQFDEIKQQVMQVHPENPIKEINFEQFQKKEDTKSQPTKRNYKDYTEFTRKPGWRFYASIIMLFGSLHWCMVALDYPNL